MSLKRSHAESNEGEGSTDIKTMRKVKIPGGLENKMIKGLPQKRVPDTPDHLPDLHIMFGAFGKVGKGKTVSYTNLINEYAKHGSLNAFYCISPTFEHNEPLKTVPWEPDGVFSGPEVVRNGEESLNQILEMIQEKKTEYEFEQEYKRIYKLWKTPKGQLQMTSEDWQIMHKENYRNPENIPWPCPCIVIDDMTHSPLMSASRQNNFTNLCLRHRHLYGLGVTIMGAFQNIHNGMAKDVRNNLGAALIYKTENKDDVEAIHRELGDGLSFETFSQMLFDATKEPHGFLFINRNADDADRFGNNFNEKYVWNPDEEKQKIFKTITNKKSKK